MTLSMADGPVLALPAGLDAYAGYVNDSGIGPTYNEMVARFPDARHLSVTTDGSPAQCADVETGAMRDWSGYDWGYCSVSWVNSLVKKYGRPKKLWTAHYTNTPHICSTTCWPGLVTTADGTQWSDNGGRYDVSLLSDDFFDLIPPPLEDPMPTISSDGKTIVATRTDGHLIVIGVGPSGTFGDASLIDLTDRGTGVDAAGGPWTFTA